MSSLVEDINKGTKRAAFLRKRSLSQSNTVVALKEQIEVFKQAGVTNLEHKEKYKRTIIDLLSKVSTLESRAVELVELNTTLTKRLENTIKAQQIQNCNSVTIGDKFFLLLQKLFYIYYNAKHSNRGGSNGPGNSVGGSSDGSHH